jgi:signal transduction histidine kinase
MTKVTSMSSSHSLQSRPESFRSSEVVISDASEYSEPQAKAANADKLDYTVDAMAHDFNNSMQGIISVLSLLQERIRRGSTEDIDRLLEVAFSSADKARQQVRRLLPQSARSLATARPVNVNSAIESIEILLTSLLGKSIEMRMQLVPHDLHVCCDEQQLENAIVNLVINSRDAMPNGGKLLIQTNTAELSLDDNGLRPGGYVAIRVMDTGAGMTSETAAHAFDPFYTTKRSCSGSGLGLWSVKEFVVQLGGQVVVHSVVGEGTSMLMFLPRQSS